MSGGRWRRHAEMVQPGPEAEPALAEALQRLRAENRELRSALCHCTQSLRQRLDELRRLQLQRRGERELLRGRWGQARQLVLHLRGQRGDSGDNGRDTAGDSGDTPGDSRDSSSDTKDTSEDIRDAPENTKDTLGDISITAGDTKTSPGDTKTSPGDTKSSPGDTKKGPGDTKTSPGDTKSSLEDIRDTHEDTKDSPGDIRDTLRDTLGDTGDSCRSAPDTSTKPLSVSPPLDDVPAVPEPPQAPPGAPPEPSSEEQLRQRLAEAEAELVALRSRVAVAELRAQDVSRAAELQLQGLRRQLEQDKAQVQAQVTSLLGELRESQNRLERSRAEREHLERRARGDAERCQQLEEQLEEVAQGHRVQLDQLRLQVTNLETALRVERRGATEEKRKLVQLQAAYHHLFQEYDAHIKASLEGDKRSQVTQEQLRAAEAALALKQELIDPPAALETIPVLQAQADIYRADFEAERAAREQLHGQREALQEELAQLRLRLGGDGARARLEEMRNRHFGAAPGPAPGECGLGGLGGGAGTPNPPGGGGAGSDRAPPPSPPPPAGFGALPPPEEGPELCCPKCQYRAPDMDTLQIHVMDCIK
ncbi:LOW QUALITY PROTEIN: NF-kappa-B essential modulator [Zonotrichia albicollis]|uniref:LOW QUALITY PROTEIN: NF-kappa-B essential modulator n=1 Tax=Zonotrichia albicollis TaxID=44394 RepID=UPI003D80BC96